MVLANMVLQSKKSFPMDKMESSYFLGVAHNVGDAFSYITLELDKYEKNERYKPQTLISSVVWKRQMDKSSPPQCVKTLTGFIISGKDGK